MLTPAQRKFFLVEQIVIPALFNLAFNAGLGWFAFREHLPLPLWQVPRSLFGEPSLGADILGMLFFLPGATCFIGTPLIERGARLGKIERVPLQPETHWLLRYFPRSLWLRSGLIGFACMALLGPLSIGILAALGLNSWSLSAAVWFKGVYAGLLAALVTPPIALYALSHRDGPRSLEREA